MLKFPYREAMSFPHLSDFFGKENIFGHSMSVKDRGIKLLRVNSRQIPGGDTRQGT